jgi:hypothetical protein
MQIQARPQLADGAQPKQNEAKRSKNRNAKPEVKNRANPRAKPEAEIRENPRPDGRVQLSARWARRSAAEGLR